MNVELVGADQIAFHDIQDVASLIPKGRRGQPVSLDDHGAVFRVNDTVWALRTAGCTRLCLIEGDSPPGEVLELLNEILGCIRSRWGKTIGARIVGSTRFVPASQANALGGESADIVDLRNELDVDESFIVTLRAEGRWHHGAFRRLTRALRGYLSSRVPDEPLPLWMTALVWALVTTTDDWSRRNPTKFVAQLDEIHLLASAFFSGMDLSPPVWDAGLDDES
ncbi:MAG: hypothetical protein HOW73_25890 [Polyangiaceae bacterium]|nr:hypothetical protein [Polyangiaceae bacterium]